jgi:hypothetical protein
MGLERTPSELQQWADAKLAELNNTPALKEDILLRKGLAKKFYEEICPLSYFANRQYANRPGIRCKPNLNNESYDALVIDYHQNPIQIHKIEFTQAIDGYDDNSRMISFLEHGHVPLVGKVTRIGTKQSGLQIIVEDEVGDCAEIVDKELKLIADAAKRKAKKPYGKDVTLVIVFNDFIAFRTEEEITTLETFVRREILPLELNFASLFLLGGWLQSVLLEFPLR